MKGALGACLLLACAAGCNHGSSGGGAADGSVGGPDASASEADASVERPDAGAPVMRGACGQDSYQWLDTEQMGDVVASTTHDPLTVAEANLARAALVLNKMPWGRSVNYATQLHELRYVTQDRGQLIEATGYYITPVVDTDTEFPVLLSLHGTSGVSDPCAPSRNLDDSSSDNFAYAVVLSLLAANGYIVVAPDYIGMKASGTPSDELSPYLVGEATAIGSWDAVRAAKKHLATLDSPKVSMGPIAVWGASQGGHAAAFTVRYAPSYAPEMNVVAGVYNVPPLDLAEHWHQALTTPQAATGFVIMAHTAMAEWYQTGGLSDVFNAPFDTTLPADLRENCRPTAVEGVDSLDDLFTPELLADNAGKNFGGHDPWSCISLENSLPTTSVPRTDSVPSLVVTGSEDNLVKPQIERDAFTALCDTGDYDDWRYLECEGAGHAQGFLWAIDDALDWIDARVAGEPLGGSCAVTGPRECSNTPL